MPGSRTNGKTRRQPRAGHFIVVACWFCPPLLFHERQNRNALPPPQRAGGPTENSPGQAERRPGRGDQKTNKPRQGRKSQSTIAGGRRTPDFWTRRLSVFSCQVQAGGLRFVCRVVTLPRQKSQCY
jgi:hypothetical protein